MALKKKTFRTKLLTVPQAEMWLDYSSYRNGSQQYSNSTELTSSHRV